MSKRARGRGRAKRRAAPPPARRSREKAMQTAVHRLVNLLTEVFEEETWQAPLTASLEGLTASQAAWKPERATNSIWMVVNHLSLWKEYHVARLTGEPPRPSGWAEKLATRTDEDLARPLPGGTSPLYKIQSMVPHDAYHCGQIRLLRALQGVPAKPF